MRMALAGQPKCRYGMLQSLYNLIEQHGCDGAIYVSDIARQTHQPMPAISRGLRQMEQTGHIVRETDPRTAARRWYASPRQGSAPAKPMSRP